MSYIVYVRLELARIFRSGITWLIILAAAVCPLAGYFIYRPAAEGTTAAIVIANPVLAGALGGSFLFAALALFEWNRAAKEGMEELADSIVSPFLMNTVRLTALLLAAAVSALLTLLLYAPYTVFRLGDAFRIAEYAKAFAVFLLPSLFMGILLPSALYQIVRRTDFAFLCFAAVMLIGISPAGMDTYLLYWTDLSSVGFSGDFGNDVIYRMVWYSRLLWLCLFGSLWIASLLCIRSYGKRFAKAFLFNLRRICLPVLSALLAAAGAWLYVNQPYMDHEPPQTLDSDSIDDSEFTYYSLEDETENESIMIRNTRLELGFDVKKGMVYGTVSYEISNTSGSRQACLLDISPGYTVHSVTADGRELPFRDLDNDSYILTKNIEVELPADKEMEVEVVYSGMIQVPANTGALFIYDEITPEYISLTGNNVAPAFHAPIDESCTFLGTVSLPSEMELICSGKTPGAGAAEEDGTRIWEMEGNGSRPVIFAGDYVRMEIKDQEFPVYFCYSRAHQREFEDLDIEKILADTVSYCTKQFGALEYNEEYPLMIVMTSAHMMGGSAADNLSYMGESFFTAENLGDAAKGAGAAEVIAHEIIHQWWGVQCFLMDMENPDWSSEALTCYTTYRMMRKQYGAEYAKKYYLDVWQEKYDNMNDNFYLRNPEYLEMLPESCNAELLAMIYETGIYAKVPLQIVKAETLVGGEEKMDEILRDLFLFGGTEMPPFVTWQDFLDACGLTEEQLALDGGEGNV